MFLLAPCYYVLLNREQMHSRNNEHPNSAVIKASNKKQPSQSIVRQIHRHAAR